MVKAVVQARAAAFTLFSFAFHLVENDFHLCYIMKIELNIKSNLYRGTGGS